MNIDRLTHQHQPGTIESYGSTAGFNRAATPANRVILSDGLLIQVSNVSTPLLVRRPTLNAENASLPTSEGTCCYRVFCAEPEQKIITLLYLVTIIGSIVGLIHYYFRHKHD